MSDIKKVDGGGKKDIDESYWAILSAALELDVKKGHLKWTMSDLSRKSGITRSLIYYYFGREKSQILVEAVKTVGDQFVGTSEERIELWKSGDYVSSMQVARAMHKKLPYVVQFMTEHRNYQNETGKALKEVEDQFLQKLKNFFPHLSESQLRATAAGYWGLCFSPFANDEAVELGIKVIIANINPGKAP